jgi:hypothetical protein
MRARRHILVALVTAVAIALAAQPAPSSTQAIECPGSTSWDNILQRCV